MVTVLLAAPPNANLRSALDHPPSRRLGVVALALALLLSGCSSTDKPGHRDGSTTTGGSRSSGGASTGGGGSGGVVDSTSTGGSGGAPPTDGGADQGADVSADLAASDGDASMTAEQACRAAIEALCQRGAACGGDPDNWQDCARVSAACPESFFNQASTRTVAGIVACLDELAQQPCTDSELGLFPSCWSPGTRPSGASCVYASNCASGSCSGNATTCGHCGDGPAATGESCASVGCRAGDFCHPGTKLCMPGTSIVHVAQGEACDLAAVPTVGCTGDLHCIAPSGQTAGTCQPLPILDLGQHCYQVTGLCRPPTVCFTLVDGVTNPSECRAPDPCGAAPCDATTFCKDGDGGRYCAPLAAVGEACAGDAGTIATLCASGAVCWANTGVCTKYGERGDPCDGDVQPCGSYLSCTNGRCAPLATEACP